MIVGVCEWIRFSLSLFFFFSSLSVSDFSSMAFADVEFQYFVGGLAWATIGRQSKISDLTQSSFVIDPKKKKKGSMKNQALGFLSKKLKKTCWRWKMAFGLGGIFIGESFCCLYFFGCTLAL